MTLPSICLYSICLGPALTNGTTQEGQLLRPRLHLHLKGKNHSFEDNNVNILTRGVRRFERGHNGSMSNWNNILGRFYGWMWACRGRDVRLWFYLPVNIHFRSYIQHHTYSSDPVPWFYKWSPSTQCAVCLWEGRGSIINSVHSHLWLKKSNGKRKLTPSHLTVSLVNCCARTLLLICLAVRLSDFPAGFPWKCVSVFYISWSWMTTSLLTD